MRTKISVIHLRLKLACEWRKIKRKESIGESKKEAWLSAKEVKKFIAEWRNNLTKWIRPCSFGNFRCSQSISNHSFCRGVLQKIEIKIAVQQN